MITPESGIPLARVNLTAGWYKRQNLGALEVFLLRQKDELKFFTSLDPTMQLLDYIHDMVRDEIRRGLFAAM